MDITIVYTVIVQELLRDLQMVFALIRRGIDLVDIAFPHKGIDLIRGVGLRNFAKSGNLPDRWPLHCLDHLYRIGLRSTQPIVGLIHRVENIFIKIQLKLRIDFTKGLLQHGDSPYGFPAQKSNSILPPQPFVAKHPSHIIKKF